jgi:hypothetical protein
MRTGHSIDASADDEGKMPATRTAVWLKGTGAGVPPPPQAVINAIDAAKSANLKSSIVFTLPTKKVKVSFTAIQRITM